MENVKRTPKIISLDQQDLLIDAMAAEKNDATAFHAIAFRSNTIEYLMEVNDTVSVLVLKSNLNIPVALPFQELKQMIYAPDLSAGAALDLTPVTGHAVQNVLVPALADTFNAKENAPLMIHATLRKYQSDLTVDFDFNENAIASYQVVNNTRAKLDSSVSITFNKAATTGPFGTSHAYIDMPYNDFVALIAEANKKGMKTLDLCKFFENNPLKCGRK